MKQEVRQFSVRIKGMLTGTVLLTLFTLAPATFANPPGHAKNWTKVFEDNFDGTSLDTTKWNTGYGWGRETDWSGEYSANENVTVSDGICHLKLDNTPNPKASTGHPYTSGSINTNHKFDQQFGYLEARIKAAKGPGFLSAFWGRRVDKSWPPELDIAEVLGREPTVDHTTVHYSPHNEAGKGSSTRTKQDLTDDFHVYGVQWTPTESIFYLDGVECFRTKTGAKELAEANKSFYWTLNVHIGNKPSNWQGMPDATTQWPASMDIDWVRVYKHVPDYTSP